MLSLPQEIVEPVAARGNGILPSRFGLVGWIARHIEVERVSRSGDGPAKADFVLLPIGFELNRVIGPDPEVELY